MLPSNASITSRYFAKLAQLNMANLVPSRFVLSPESFHKMQSELFLEIGKIQYYEYVDLSTGLKETLFGIPVEVDPRLTDEAVRIEIDI